MASNLTLRYILGLSLIALTMCSTYALLSHRTAANKDDGYIINLAGMQRTLSQRIALRATQIAYGSASEQELVRLSIADSIAQMTANHEVLVRDSRDRLNAGAYAKGGDLDKRVQRFLETAGLLVRKTGSEAYSNTRVSALVDELRVQVDEGLLQNLDSAVTGYQKAYELKIEQFLTVEKTILALGLLLLLLEVVFIFRPMVRRVEHAIGALETSNRELREFTYRITHDLRAPIASSLGMVSMAEESLKTKDHATVNLALTQIGAVMNRMDELIKDILSVAKNRGATAELNQVSVAKLVDEVNAKLIDQPGFNRVKLSVSVPAKLTVVTVKAYLAQILENLLSNAIKYQNPGQTAPSIELEIRNQGEYCAISVSDNGLGVPEEYQTQLFQMFRRFHPKVASGSGLGLYLVQQNALALGGDAKFTPLEPGTRFDVRVLKNLKGLSK